MGNKQGSSARGERHAPAHPAEYAKCLSSIDPLPFFPNLARRLRGPTNAVVLTYLEILHPTPQDPNGDYLNVPVGLDCDSAAEDLQISRRTLHIAFHCLASWFKEESERVRAERAGRAFINPAHSVNGQIKFYSIVGPSGWNPGQSVSIKRNHQALQAAFSALHPLCFPVIETVPTQQDQSRILPLSRICASRRSLCDVLREVMPNWGDRRVERWDRWRRLEGREPTNLRRMRQATSSLDVVTPRE
jgi:hypothetical protein